MTPIGMVGAGKSTVEVRTAMSALGRSWSCWPVVTWGMSALVGSDKKCYSSTPPRIENHLHYHSRYSPMGHRPTTGYLLRRRLSPPLPHSPYRPGSRNPLHPPDGFRPYHSRLLRTDLQAAASHVRTAYVPPRRAPLVCG